MTSRSHEEYLVRRIGTDLLPLSTLHHNIMDLLFYTFDDNFSFDDAFRLAMESECIIGDSAMDHNPNRVKLAVIRAVHGLTAVGMIRQSESDPQIYFIDWPTGK